MHIALLNPEIPGNTGSIGRLCVGTDTPLHLVGELGFSIDAAAVRRAGLDYWKHVALHRHADLDALLAATAGQRVFAFSKRGATRYDRVDWRADDVLFFGPESTGFSAETLGRFADRTVFIPTQPAIRSLNLATAASIALFEALRQQDFAGIEHDHAADGPR